jgi:transcriptional regulator with XRE-family HTH domain
MNQTHELRVHRKSHQLSQEELAHLINVSSSMILRMERGAAAQLADVEAMLALEVVFGKPLSGIFAALHIEVEDAVMRRAAELHAVWDALGDARSKAKVAFAESIASRGRSSRAA